MVNVLNTILVDDHQIFIEGLKSVLQKSSLEVIATAADGNEALELIQFRQPEFLILDLNLPGKDGLEILSFIKYHRLPIKTLVLSMYADPKIVRSALKKGAKGYLLKDRDIHELKNAIEEIIKGNIYLGKGLPSVSIGNEKLRKRSPIYSDPFTKKHYLTKREIEILNLIAQAMSNKEIARELFISDQTVGVHRKNIMRKLGVSNTAGLVKLAYDHSLVQTP